MKKRLFVIAPVILAAVLIALAGHAGKIMPNLWTMAFGPVPLGTGQTMTLTLTNVGGAAGTVGAIGISGVNPNDFKVIGGSCTPTTVLEPGKSCTLDVRLSPLALGPRQANLTIQSVVQQGK